MNRQNFIGHLALALTLVLLAAFAGQIRRMQKNWRAAESTTPPAKTETTIPPQEAMPVEHDEGEVLVRFKPGTTLGRIQSIAARLNDQVEDQFEYINDYAVIDDQDGLDSWTVAAQYRTLPEVEYAEPNFEIELDPREGEEFDADADAETEDSASEEAVNRSNVTPNDPMFGEQWALQNTGQREGKAKADINALKAWVKTTGSDKVVIAVLDSGVDYTHPDLIHNIWVRPGSIGPYTDAHLGEVDDEHGYNAVENSGDPIDENGHGTHCAGIIGAEGSNDEGIAGVNWKVEILPLKFMTAGGFGTTKDAIECINYVIARKRSGVNVRVISASWGSTMKSRALEDAIRKAGEEGILFVAASGNASANTDRQPHYPSSYDLPNVISVAALNRRDGLASFSNYGPKSVHIAAPGAEILSTWLNREYEEHSGTSMATPVVSGVAGLVLSIEPHLSVKELRERLLKSADKLDSLNGKIITGGRINASRAVNAD